MIPPVMHVHLDNSSEQAVTAMGSNASVRFTGDLQVDKLPGESVDITMGSSLDTGWPTVVAPTKMNFGSEDTSKSFTVNVTVPYWASADLVAHLSVAATWTGPVTLIAYGNANVTVKAYYGMKLGTDDILKEAPPGGHASFKVRVDNLGNSDVSYRMNITNEDRLTGRGMTVSIEPRTFELARGYSGPVHINISAPREWTLGKDEMSDIEVTASFDNGTGAHSERLSLEFWVHGPDPLTLQVLYGGIATIILVASVLTGFIVLRRRWRGKKE